MSDSGATEGGTRNGFPLFYGCLFAEPMPLDERDPTTSAIDAVKSLSTAVHGHAAQFLFDPEKPVVFGEPLAP